LVVHIKYHIVVVEEIKTKNPKDVIRWKIKGHDLEDAVSIHQ
jgi:hypothetical protein